MEARRSQLLNPVKHILFISGKYQFFTQFNKFISF